MKKQLYIAYGSNLNIEQMAMRCPGAVVVGTAVIPDYRLVFQGRPFGAHANIVPAEGQSVPVAVWTINPTDEAMLDRYEGVRGGYYTKEYMDVEIDGKKQKALIYIMTPNGYGIPDDSYLNTIAKGYEDFELPAKVLNDAVVYSREQKMARRRLLV